MKKINVAKAELFRLDSSNTSKAVIGFVSLYICLAISPIGTIIRLEGGTVLGQNATRMISACLATSCVSMFMSEFFYSSEFEKGTIYNSIFSLQDPGKLFWGKFLVQSIFTLSIYMYCILFSTLCATVAYTFGNMMLTEWIFGLWTGIIKGAFNQIAFLSFSNWVFLKAESKSISFGMCSAIILAEFALAHLAGVYLTDEILGSFGFIHTLFPSNFFLEAYEDNVISIVLSIGFSMLIAWSFLIFSKRAMNENLSNKND
ncbi:MAG: hypothetical protein FWG10_07315 [Eubacteriaceae bacterium]|nr:hypothetical protein [Eubacteriaceae bacterium]